MASEDLLTKRGKKGRFHLKSYHQDLSGKNKQAKEVMFKVASNITTANPKSVGQAMDYISRNGERFDEEFISPEDEFGNKLNQDELKKLQEKWEKEFSEEKRKDSRVMTHFVLSIDEKPTEENLKKFETATRDFLQERLGDEGYRYMFVIHKHNDKAHAHILVNNNNEITKKKLRTNKEWFLESRIMAKEKLIEQGFNYKATLKQDRKRHVEMEKETVEQKKEEEQKLQGEILVEHGKAPYQFDEDNKDSYYVKLSNDAVIWGVGLKDALEKADAGIGDRINLESKGTETVQVQDKDGKTISAERVAWAAEITETADEIAQKKEQREEQGNDQGKVKPTEKSTVSDWFDAQLKKVARNDAHYQTLLEWKAILTEARQSHIEKAEVSKVRNQIIALDRYSRNASSPEALSKVIRDAGLTHEDIRKARERVDKRKEHQDRKLEYRIRATARDLLKAEIGIELSPDMTPEKKAEMLAVIEKTKKQIDPKNTVNFYGMKQKLIEEANYSPQLDKYLKEIGKVNRAESVTDKNIYRLFRQTPEDKLSPAEQQVFKRERDKTLDALEEKGHPARGMLKRWQEMEKISRRAKALEAEQNQPGLSPNDEQKLINAMRERLEKVAHSKRDQIRVSKSLDAAQKALDKRTESERGPLQANVFKQLAGLKSFDKKQEENKEQLAKRQLFAMTKAYLGMKQAFDTLSVSEKASLAKPMAKLETELVARGADLQHVRTRQSISMQIENSHTTMKEVLAMTRPTIKQIDDVIKQTAETKELLKESSYTVTEQRASNQGLNLTRENAIQMRQARESEFKENLRKLEKLHDNAVRLSKTNDNSPTARFAIKKQLESLQKQFDALSKELNRDIQLVGGTRSQFNFKRDLDNKAKVFGQSRGYER
jgi:hypothetical protein